MGKVWRRHQELVNNSFPRCPKTEAAHNSTRSHLNSPKRLGGKFSPTFGLSTSSPLEAAKNLHEKLLCPEKQNIASRQADRPRDETFSVVSLSNQLLDE